ncbi:MAG TPA: methylated-DNA--[protein]-cysteine S-methyltransferase [Candidatus Limnocylindria bacterium]|nr:methylated-DNA--[protein]-cysteine S-methyltransferase [Candidatus Limnocylindria bacterium]
MTDLEQRLSRPPTPAIDPSRVTAELARRADAEGLLDVAWATLDTPLGPIAVFVTPRGLVRVAYDRENFGQVADEVAEHVSPRVLLAPERTDVVREQLDDYFEARRRTFDLPIDWTLVHGFNQGVLRATAEIPFGETASYGDVAAAAGSPRAARAAGNALAGNPIPIVVPCHRVIHADGGIGGYTGGLENKRFLLSLEGVGPR